MRNVIVVGGGLASLSALQRLRARGYEGRLTLVGAESHPPYDRPPLSKAVLAGDTDGIALPADWEALRCERLLGTRAEALRLHDGRPGGALATSAGPLPFDGLVIATGAMPVRLPGEGPQHVLRTLDDAERLRDSLRAGARVVLVGAGWIGAEVATAAARKGCRVTVLEAGDAPLAGALGPGLGALTAGWYAECGVELRCGVRVASVDPGGLTLADGSFLPADAVVTGVGVRPEVGWLAGSGLEVAGGVVVDGSLRTARPEVVAAGDCASWWSARYGRRLTAEHWDTALNAPDVAAAALLGQEALYDPVPYVWSEQFGRMVQYAGHHAAADRVVFRGTPDGPDWTALWLSGDRLRALLTVDRPRDMAQGRRLLARGTPVNVDLITDPGTALSGAVRRAAAPAG
ncbi:FAD-dependent oxidoreductase [Streptomyces sp. MK7]|uniref:NAD(P)/FAD-dependent oxidoreductase n=1 Tax=Streptomyces sp. MK7 TaxID=3067635 RepID=UPI00293084A3|nr:FAD-dependent oxidoreductase [Streptomyces sp. MK7]